MEDEKKDNFDLPREKRLPLRKAIKNCLMRINQVNELVIVLSMGAVTILKLDEENGG